ncbi:MAG: 50S ribosomal protein L16 [Bdellovibrionales bacterium]|nr:50S ribosomal protein L16 [Bdellovibrionales bacterium]
MLAPKRVKWRKQSKGKNRGRAIKGSGGELFFGEFGLQALEPGRINSKQLEAARVAMTRSVKRGGSIWVRIFPHKPITKKPAETRMGSGKGGVEEWAAMIKPGRIIFEMGGVTQAEAYEALRLASHKLPNRFKCISKDSEAKAMARLEATRAAKRAKRAGVAPAPAAKAAKA